MKGFILAAGEGTRLNPITLEIPKPLLPVGKIPILTYLVTLYLKYGVDDIKINIPKIHQDDFWKWKATHFPGKKIEFIVEEKPSGDFTPLAKKVSKRWFNEPIVVSNGDELKDLDLRKMINWHFKKGGIATVGVLKVEDPRPYGVVRFDGDRIVEFIEKPEKPPSNYVNSGLFVFNPEIRDYHPSGAKFAMLSMDLLPKLAQQGKLYGYRWQGKWFDCGTFERWEKAIRHWNGSEFLKV